MMGYLYKNTHLYTPVEYEVLLLKKIGHLYEYFPRGKG